MTRLKFLYKLRKNNQSHYELKSKVYIRYLCRFVKTKGNGNEKWQEMSEFEGQVVVRRTRSQG